MRDLKERESRAVRSLNLPRRRSGETGFIGFGPTLNPRETNR